MKHRHVVGALLCCSGIVVGVGIWRLWAQQGNVMPEGTSPSWRVDLAELRYCPAKCWCRSHASSMATAWPSSHTTRARRLSFVVVRRVVCGHRGEVVKENKVGAPGSRSRTSNRLQRSRRHRSGGRYIEVDNEQNRPATAAPTAAR